MAEPTAEQAGTERQVRIITKS